MAPAKITFLVEGSRGDVQPYVALALALQEDAAFEVKFCTCNDFKQFCHRYGIRSFVGTSSEARVQLKKFGAKAQGEDLKKVMETFSSLLAAQFQTKQKEVANMIRGADLVLANGFFQRYLAVLRESDPATYPPSIMMHLQPAVPNKMYPPCFNGDPNNKDYMGQHRNLCMTAFSTFKNLYNPWRKELGLEEWSEEDYFESWCNPGPTLHAFSPSFIERPSASDWPEDIVTTGYWFLPSSESTQYIENREMIEDFLDQHAEKPLYIGFGSMTHQDPDQLLSTVIHAVRQAKCPAILSEGWDTLKKPEGFNDPDILFVGDVDHSWLFPKCKAAVIHGGAGTTGACLRFGLPTLVIPFFTDQPFWGDQVHKRNCGPAPLSSKDLQVDELASAIHLLLTDDSMRKSAVGMAEKIAQEDGIATAIDYILQILDNQ